MPDNRKPLMYGAFPVCRNYTVRAHIRNLGAPKRRRRENGIQYAWTLRRGIHAKNLHPRHTADPGKRSRKDGQFHGAGHVNTQPKTKSGGEDKTNILSAALWTFRRVGHGVGQAGFHRFSRSAFPKMVYRFIGKILLG